MAWINPHAKTTAYLEREKKREQKGKNCWQKRERLTD